MNKTFLTQHSILSNERGLATIETIPLLVLFFFLMSYGLGLFGFVHSATLHTIAARTYALETFHNRTNVNYFRDDGSDPIPFSKKGYRVHAIRNYTSGPNEDFVPDTARIAFSIGRPAADNNPETHNTRIFDMKAHGRNRNVQVSPGWIMTAQGICLTSQCGGD